MACLSSAGRRVARVRNGEAENVVSSRVFGQSGMMEGFSLQFLNVPLKEWFLRVTFASFKCFFFICSFLFAFVILEIL